MKNIVYTIGSLILMVMVTACGHKEVIRDDSSAQDQVTKSVVASLPDEGIILYENEEGALLEHGQETQYFPWLLSSPRYILPRLEMIDLNKDGIDELICITTIGSGTGVSVEELHVLTLEADTYVDHVYDAMVVQLEEVFHWKWAPSGHSLALYIEDDYTELSLTDDMLTYGVEDLKPNTSIVRYELEEDQIILKMPIVALSDNVPMGLYTFNWFSAVLDFDGASFQLKDVVIQKEGV